MIGSHDSHAQFPFPPRVPFLSGRWLFLIMAVSVLLDGILLHATGLKIGETPAVLGFGLWAAVAMFICYRLRAPVAAWQQTARDLVEGVSLFALVSLLGAIASYPLAAGRHPLVDPELERVDLVFHFHWVNWYIWVADHAWLQPVERIAYLSIFVTPALLIGYFAWAGRRAESRMFVATFWVAVVITLSLFPLLPAAGPLATLWHGETPYMPLSALYQDEVIVALRRHMIHTIDLGQLHGLVCAPSFHAASAVIYIVTASRIRVLRWPLIGLNAIMLLATPVEGTHYLADLFAGAAVAGLALWIAPRMVQWTEKDRVSRRPDFRDAVPVTAELSLHAVSLPASESRFSQSAQEQAKRTETMQGVRGRYGRLCSDATDRWDLAGRA